MFFFPFKQSIWFCNVPCNFVQCQTVHGRTISKNCCHQFQLNRSKVWFRQMIMSMIAVVSSSQATHWWKRMVNVLKKWTLVLSFWWVLFWNECNSKILIVKFSFQRTSHTQSKIPKPNQLKSQALCAKRQNGSFYSLVIFDIKLNLREQSNAL